MNRMPEAWMYAHMYIFVYVSHNAFFSVKKILYHTRCFQPNTISNTEKGRVFSCKTSITLSTPQNLSLQKSHWKTIPELFFLLRDQDLNSISMKTGEKASSVPYPQRFITNSVVHRQYRGITLPQVWIAHLTESLSATCYFVVSK